MLQCTAIAQIMAIQLATLGPNPNLQSSKFGPQPTIGPLLFFGQELTVCLHSSVCQTWSGKSSPSCRDDLVFFVLVYNCFLVIKLVILLFDHRSAMTDEDLFFWSSITFWCYQIVVKILFYVFFNFFSRFQCFWVLNWNLISV